MAVQKAYNFILVFKSKGHALVNRISRMMLILAIAVFIFTLLPFTKSAIWSLILTVAIIAWWIYTEMRAKNNKPVFYRIALLLAGVGWYIQPGGLILSILYLIAALMEKQVKFPQEVAFDRDEIVVNSFPRKHFGWDMVNNIILKDGLLTIDFISNRLIQKELESFPSIKEEKEFNDFCVENLQKAVQVAKV